MIFRKKHIKKVIFIQGLDILSFNVVHFLTIFDLITNKINYYSIIMTEEFKWLHFHK